MCERATSITATTNIGNGNGNEHRVFTGREKFRNPMIDCVCAQLLFVCLFAITISPLCIQFGYCAQ